MEYRNLGRTGLSVSALGFGCGNVGGLMVRGTPADQERAVARAIELGVNYFDTAPSYGDGQSEQNLGRVLRVLKPSIYVGTKFRILPAERRDAPAALTRSLETSLRRLGLDRLDLLQCHEHIVAGEGQAGLSARALLEDVVPALDKLRQQGKIRFFGITALGETPALHQVIDAGVLSTAQVCLNLLNPSAAFEVPPGFPAQDFGRLLPRARTRGVGAIVIRVLAAGALSGVEARHPIAVPSVDPIASGPDYTTDVRRAQALRALVDEGHADSLVEASLRLPLASDAVSTVLLGYSTQEHLEGAAKAIAKGPLSSAALDRLKSLWGGLATVR
jgi:L-galactose dehydrogenase/L-glyceraldehyde 3-phosphate reductase